MNQMSSRHRNLLPTFAPLPSFPGVTSTFPFKFKFGDAEVQETRGAHLISIIEGKEKGRAREPLGRGSI